MTKKKSRAGRKSKVRITKSGKQMKPCPCPIHRGKELPLTEEHFQRARDSWQGYCKEWRNKAYKEWYESKKGKKKKTPNSHVAPRKTISDKKSPKLTDKPIEKLCPKCNEWKLWTTDHWQSNGRGSLRQPCKKCLKKKSDIK